MAQAKEEGKAKVGILAVQPNGSGQVKASFEADSFFDDLALVLDAPPQSEEDDTEAAAGELLDKFFPRKKV